MPASEIIKELKKYKNPRNAQGMKRFGICGKNLLGGPNVPTLRKMAKDIKKTTPNRHEVAIELWKSGIHEARILASMIDDPDKLTAKQMDSWTNDFDSWDVCDQTCMNLYVYYPKAFSKAIEWSNNKKEFIKRAGFALMAVLAWKSKDANDDQFTKLFPIIIKEATDERNYVKKAVNWALRQIGKRNNALKIKAIKTAKNILELDSKSAKWIARDALKELSSK